MAANAFDSWKKLPDCSPADIDMSRKVKVLLTGDLERDIYTNPFFFGKEKNYLRAQIARIYFSTALKNDPVKWSKSWVWLALYLADKY